MSTFGKPESPLPTLQAVREMLEGLLGREVEVSSGAGMTDPQAPGGAVVAEYVSDAMQLHALVVVDVPAAAHVGAALGLIPARVAEEDAAAGALSENLFEALAEVLNVFSALFNLDGAPHLRVGSIHPPQAMLPNDVAPWLMAYVPRLDIEVNVSSYGGGNISIIIVP